MICVFFRHLNSLMQPCRLLVFLSPLSAAVRQSDSDEMHVQASEEGSHFRQAKEAVEIILLQHPFGYTTSTSSKPWRWEVP